jgi:LmbE family N-acetylglucosaminyl deacetylase
MLAAEKKIRNLSLEILSPHLDDAVYSCWHAIEASTRVTTVFTGYPVDEAPSPWDVSTGFDSSREAMQARLAENTRALRPTRAQIMNLDLLDAQYRCWPLEATEIAEVLDRLLASGIDILAPLGFTHAFLHEDHELLREAAKKLAQQGRAVSYYADIPYSAPSGDASGWPFKIPMSKVEELLGADVTIEVISLTPEEQAQKKQAVQTYRSQFRRNNALAGDILNDLALYMHEVVVRPA